MATFEIYFSDLTEHAQKCLLEKAQIAEPEQLYWDFTPLATIELEVNEEW